MLDAGAAHAAFLLLIAFGVKLAANAVGIELNDEAYFTIAGVIVTYILSLVAHGLYVVFREKRNGLTGGDVEYKPPFT